MVMGSNPIGGYWHVCDSLHVRVQAKLSVTTGKAGDRAQRREGPGSQVLTLLTCCLGSLAFFLASLCDFTSLYFQLCWPRFFLTSCHFLAVRLWISFFWPRFFLLSFSLPPLRSPWPHVPRPPPPKDAR